MNHVHFRKESAPKSARGEPGKAMSFKLSLKRQQADEGAKGKAGSHAEAQRCEWARCLSHSAEKRSRSWAGADCEGPRTQTRGTQVCVPALQRAMLSITCAVALSRSYSFCKSLLQYQFLRKLLPDPTPPVPG